MYVIGCFGALPGCEPKMMLWSFDPATSEWKRLASMPEGIHHPGFATVGNKLYSIGGVTVAGPAGGRRAARVPSGSVWLCHIGPEAGAQGSPVPTPGGARARTATGATDYPVGRRR